MKFGKYFATLSNYFTIDKQFYNNWFIKVMYNCGKHDYRTEILYNLPLYLVCNTQTNKEETSRIINEYWRQF